MREREREREREMHNHCGYLVRVVVIDSQSIDRSKEGQLEIFKVFCLGQNSEILKRG